MRINPITPVGIALILLGIVAFAYQGITYTSREKIIDIGPFQATADEMASRRAVQEGQSATRPDSQRPHW
jgi:hypothetical protein